MKLDARRLVALVPLLCLAQVVHGDVQRLKFTLPPAYLIIEVLDDDLLHFEYAAVGDPPVNVPLYASPMTLKRDYGGPSSFSSDASRLETAQLRAAVNPANLCVRLEDKARQNAYLTTVCPVDLHKAFKGLDVDPGAMEHVYGLGQEFKIQGSADGDWTAFGVRQGQGFGNAFMGFQNAAVGNVQIPVMYAVGAAQRNYGLFLDNVYKQRWDFNANWWQLRMYGDQVRFYFMSGPDLPDLRADYLELTGRPPVPPRKAFGLWVSEFGYDTWEEIDQLAAGLRAEHFPLDGFVLDLNWFGGVVPDDATKSTMGRLDWDQSSTDGNPYFFPDPDARIKAYADDHIGLVAIEESYLANTTATFSQMPPALSSYRRSDGRCDRTRQSNAVTDISGFWGTGRMIDWSDPLAGVWIHEQRRYPNLVHKGVTGHWTDLGEPETFNADACYEGVEVTGSGVKNEHSDIHNLYNLLWNQSIWDGYVRRQGQANALGQVNPRPLIVTRSGAAGTQRFGTTMWSGDIAANLESLATHLNAQLHMSFSGIDFYGSDSGGFRREVLPYNDKQGRYRGYEAELYTQWLANAAWFDVPLRPHTDNEFVKVNPPYATAPHRLGKIDSNLANIRQRYELIPYYYSLAYRAHLFGEPLVPPLVFHHQDDARVRRAGHEKLIGKDLLVAAVARHGEYERDVYLPAGTWVNYHSNEWHVSTGTVIADVPVYRDAILRLPAYARAGAILPLMTVDEATLDASGNRADGARRDELVVKVFADAVPSGFTLYEDDGTTLRYDAAGRPLYHHRTTQISQQRDGDTATVRILPATDVNGSGPYPGAATQRANIVKLVARDAQAMAVTVNGAPLTQASSAAAFQAATSGWFNAGANLILAKSPPADVYAGATVFSFDLRPVAPTSSVHFVCDKGVTVPGESLYVVGNIAALGGWNPEHAVRLAPNVYYEYIWNPPPGHNGPGPVAPVWTGVVHGLPAATAVQWKCIRRREDDSGAIQWEPGDDNRFTTSASGYSGSAYGTF